MQTGKHATARPSGTAPDTPTGEEAAKHGEGGREKIETLTPRSAKTLGALPNLI